MSETSMPRVANPAPLGLAAFGVTTVVLSCINAGLLKGDTPNLLSVVVPLAFAYGGVAQFITGFLEYKNGNTFGTVAFTSYGAFWCWYAFLLWTAGAGWIKPPAANAVGLALLMWGVLTLLLWIATFRINFVLWTVFFLLWITFFLLAGGDLGMGTGWHTAGGWVGLITGVDALFLSFAEVTNSTFGSTVISVGGPIIRRNLLSSGQTGKPYAGHPEGIAIPVAAPRS
ncbi:MAG: acetate uptake transporter [Acidobacteriota bacterium]|nr:acetate uptake transporter [Acidobacteriota bacterium]